MHKPTRRFKDERYEPNEVRGRAGGTGEIINHGWDFIKLRLSCAQCIVYYPVLRGGFARNQEIHWYPAPTTKSSLITWQGFLALPNTRARACARAGASAS